MNRTVPQQISFPQIPNSYTHHRPEQCCPTDHEPGAVIWQELPNANRKHDQGNAAHACASRISACGPTASNCSAHGFLLLAFALVLFNQSHAAGENRRKGKEQPTETGPHFLESTPA